MRNETYEHGVPSRKRNRNRIALITLFVAGAVGPTVILASPASAALPGLVRVSAVTATDSNSPKSVTATCPAGRQLLGTGAEINGATGEVVVNDQRPDGGVGVAPTSVFVRAVEEDAFGGNWNVTAYAICANPIAGLERRTATSAAGAPDYASATANCPTDRRLLGTGFAFNGSMTGTFPNAIGNIVLDDLRPNGGPGVAPTSVLAGGYEADPDYLNTWSATSFGICAFTGAVPGLERLSSITGPGVSPDSQSTTVRCANGKLLTGTGAEINGAGGEVVIDDLRPSGTPPSANFATGYEADPNHVPNWTLTAYAICANP